MKSITFLYLAFLLFPSLAMSQQQWLCPDPAWATDYCPDFPKTVKVTYDSSNNSNNYVLYCQLNTGGEPTVAAFCGQQIPGGAPYNNGSGGQGNRPACSVGSRIQIDSLSVSESVPVNGTNEVLTYTSDRVVGSKGNYLLHVPLSGYGGVPIAVYVRGPQGDSYNYFATPPTSYDFIWDGKDANGNLQLGSAQFIVYIMNYSGLPTSVPPPDVPCPGQNCPHPRFDFDQMRTYHSFTFVYNLGTWNAKTLGMGGLNISSHHYYDSRLQKLYRGDGLNRSGVFGIGLKYGANGEIITASSAVIYTEGFLVTSEDASEAYIFDLNGRHLSTRSAATGKTLKTFSYDSNGFLTSILDSFGNTTLITRVASQVLIQAPHGQITTINLNASGLASSIQEASGRTYSASYKDSEGLLTSFTKPNGLISTFSYDSDGLLTADSNSANSSLALSQTFDPVTRTRNILATTAGGRVTSYSLVSAGESPYRTETVDSQQLALIRMGINSQSTQIQLANGYNENRSYVADQRFPFVSRIPSYSSISFSSGSANLSESHSDTFDATTNVLLLLGSSRTYTVNGNAWAEAYDSATKKWTLTSPVGRVSSVSLNDYDQVVNQQNSSFTAVAVGYDTSGRFVTATQGPRVVTAAYDTNGYISSITNPLNQTTSFTRNAAGQVLTQTLPDSRVIGFSYDANLNLASVTPPSKPAHAFTSNLLDLPITYTAPTLASTSYVTTYSYNNDRQLTQIQRPDGSTIVNAYNTTNNRLNAVTTTQGTYSLGWNYGKSDIEQIAAPDNQTTYFQYAAHLRSGVTSIDGNSSGLSLSYSRNFNSNMLASSETVTPASGSASTINFTYDNDMLLTGAGDETIVRSATTGLQSSTTLGSTTETFGYNSFGEVSSYLAKYNSTSLYSQTNTRDNGGRVSGRTVVTNGATSAFVYTYDTTGRLTDVTKNGAAFSHYNYDSNSNITSGTRAAAALATATYDAQDRITARGTTTYGYNLNGERTSMLVGSATTTYAYDAFGNLKSVTLPAKTITYTLDGRGNRVVRKSGTTITHRYFYDTDSKLIAVMNAAGAMTQQFIYGSKSHVPDYMLVGNTKYRLITDHLGSVRIVANAATGAVSQRIDYDEFGKVLSDTSVGFQPFYFAGGMYDTDTKLVHFGAREYDPETMRWMTKDPIDFSGGDLNLYGYVLMDPINLVDPSGLEGEPGQISTDPSPAPPAPPVPSPNPTKGGLYFPVRDPSTGEFVWRYFPKSPNPLPKPSGIPDTHDGRKDRGGGIRGSASSSTCNV